MRTSINVDISYEQVLSIVKSLPQKQKLQLSRELEKEGIRSRLTLILGAFKTDDLDMETITNETESVRQEIYDSRKKL